MVAVRAYLEVDTRVFALGEVYPKERKVGPAALRDEPDGMPF